MNLTVNAERKSKNYIKFKLAFKFYAMMLILFKKIKILSYD